jgi:hypothetical protein
MHLPERAEDTHAALAEACNTRDLATVLSMFCLSV